MSKKYNAKDLVRVLDTATAAVTYGVPRHIPMNNWNDYELVPNSEVEGAVDFDFARRDEIKLRIGAK